MAAQEVFRFNGSTECRTIWSETEWLSGKCIPDGRIMSGKRKVAAAQCGTHKMSRQVMFIGGACYIC